MPENNQILSVEGQLVGIPLQEYTAGPGIVVDNVNKVIKADNTVTVLTNLSDIGTKAVSGTNWSTTSAVIANNWVNLICSFDPNAAQTVNTDTAIFTVKAALRPAATIRANFVVTNAAGRGVMELDTSGVIRMRMNNGVAANNMYNRTFNFIYPLASVWGGN